MMAAGNSHIDAAIGELEKHGAVVLGITRGGKHPRVRFRFGSVERFFVCPGTPGDEYRGAKNVQASVRHVLGVVQPVKRTGERRKKRVVSTVVEVKPPAELTVRPDPMTRLAEHELAPEVRRIRYGLAWQDLWDRCLGGVPWWRLEMGSPNIELSMTTAWAIWNATRLPGREWTFERFVGQAVRVDALTVEIPLEQGMRGRVRGGQVMTASVVDGDEVVSMPLPEERLIEWMEQAAPRVA